MSKEDILEIISECEEIIAFRKQAEQKAKDRGNEGAERMWRHKREGVETVLRKLKKIRIMNTKTAEECKDQIARDKGYSNWKEYYNWIAREGQRPDVVAQLTEAATELAMKEWAASQSPASGGRWVKASERLPGQGETKPLKIKYNGEDGSFYDVGHVSPFTDSFIATLDAYPFERVEWLDESPGEGQQEEVERLKGLIKRMFDEEAYPEQWHKFKSENNL